MIRKTLISVFTLLALTPIASAADYTLDSIRHMARTNYPLIRQYQLIEQTARYDIINAARAYLPQLSLSAGATYQSDVVSFPEAFDALFAMMGKEVEGVHPDQYKIALNLNQTIWDGGVSKANADIAKAEREVQLLTTETEFRALRERIDQIFFGALILDEQAKQIRLIHDILISNSNFVQANVTNGTVPK